MLFHKFSGHLIVSGNNCPQLLYGLNYQRIGKRFASPMKLYMDRVQSGDLAPDRDQSLTIQLLDKLYNNIQRYKPRSQQVNSGGGFLGKLLGKGGESVKLVNTSAPQGLYIWGSVGGGKTTLMDIFYESCDNV